MADRHIEDRALVFALLEAAGIAAPDDDVDAIASGYRAARRMIASLYTMSGVRYEVPAVTFEPRVSTP